MLVWWLDGKVFVDVEDEVRWEEIKNEDFTISPCIGPRSQDPLFISF